MWFSGMTTRTATYFKQAHERKPPHPVRRLSSGRVTRRFSSVAGIPA